MEAIDTSWRKASYSGNGGGSCVEVGNGHQRLVMIRDTKLSDSPVLAFSADEWRRFLADVKRR